MLTKLLRDIADCRVLVVGDAMLDRYWHGGVDRISPEAPVPVVSVKHVDERPGGAANVARNARALGANCRLLSITGDDAEANTLERLLKAEGIDCSLYRDKLINTIVKLRVISRNQQLIRLDFESPASKDSRVRLLDYYLEHLRDYGVVIVSDYGKGGLGYVQEMISAARNAGVPVVVDPKGDDYSSYRRATLLTPNRKEFEQVAGKCRDDAELERRAAAMVAALELDGLLITRSDEGISMVEKDGRVLHMPARAREVYDVTGAGDSVIAVMGCAYAVGGRLEDALALANIAAGVVVGKLGAATASPQEILRELHQQET
jgi:rfaE bifunctional protein kinase chain/domain